MNLVCSMAVSLVCSMAVSLECSMAVSLLLLVMFVLWSVRSLVRGDLDLTGLGLESIRRYNFLRPLRLGMLNDLNLYV